MTQEEKDLQKAKVDLEGAQKQLDHLNLECGKRLAEAVAHEAAHTTLEKVAEIVGHGVLRSVPILGWTLTGLDIVGKVQLVNSAYGPCYEKEINHWKSKVRDAEEKYKDRADRAEIGEKISIVIREEIRQKLIDKEMELKKTRGDRWKAESEYRELHDRLYGPQVWAQDNKFSDKTLANLKMENKKKVTDLLKNKIK